jgi:hypothetical protein
MHLCNLFDKMMLRKMWLGWNAAVALEKKGLKIMRRVLMRVVLLFG